MNARRFLNVIHTWLIESQGPEKADEILNGKQRWRETLPAGEVAWAEVSSG